MSSELKNDGLLDNEWCEVSIADLCLNIYSGGTPKSTEPKYFENGVIPWLKTKEVNYSKITETENFITTDGLKNSSAKLVPVNSVIVAMYGNGDTAGRVAINKIELTTNQACCNLVINPEKADYRFVYYYLMSQYSKLVDLKNGGAQQNLNSKLIKDFPILTPELATQGEIGAFLESLDDRIALLRETNATIEAIAQALFKSWFVDFDPVHANAAALENKEQAPSLPPEIQALFPATFTDSPQGSIPDGWELGHMQDLFVLQRGFDLPASVRVEGAYPLIAASGPNGTHAEAMVKGPGVVTGRSGVLGKVFFTLDDFWPLNTTLWIKEFKRATPCYAFEVLRRLDTQSFNAGSAVPSLNRNHINGLPYILPPQVLVNHYEGIALTTQKKIHENNKQADSLIAIRDTLLPRLISGQLRLPEAEQAIAAITD